ncbi:Predicted methylated DNA-protein cysteine methyltransferase [Serratia rubidaea]|uniref:Predicted methylated DNA-protein cysteine methyltransferase n=1 Tax=Serratia rubidaea TaxID=61652 RepID=A0A4U9HD52_SERRU|nr:Predicted methylated DNA-protein cysteine methyltransferase [Serratia rubidaea]
MMISEIASQPGQPLFSYPAGLWHTATPTATRRTYLYDIHRSDFPPARLSRRRRHSLRQGDRLREVAALAGSPRAARQVGGVLKKLPPGSTLPWHRVINRHGKISLRGEDFQRQRQALLAEGLCLMPRARWTLPASAGGHKQAAFSRPAKGSENGQAAAVTAWRPMPPVPVRSAPAPAAGRRACHCG